MSAQENPPPPYESRSDIGVGLLASSTTNASSSSSPATPFASVAANNTTHRPIYTPPEEVQIGKHTGLCTLVLIKEVKGHLGLLHAISTLKKRVDEINVEDLKRAGLVDFPLEAGEDDKKWAWVVGLAVERRVPATRTDVSFRFDIWCRNLTPRDVFLPSVAMPPVDVLMVWHSYMLNPRWYAEDCTRIDRCGILKKFEVHFECLLTRTASMLTSPPSAAREQYWQSKTGMPFDLLAAIPFLKTRSVICPKCWIASKVVLMNRAGTGYLQENFEAICPNRDCKSVITKAKLASYKLAFDLASPDIHLAGTQFGATHLDKKAGDAIKKEFIQSFLWENLSPSDTHARTVMHQVNAISILLRANHSLEKLRARMSHDRQPRLIRRIMSAYNDDKVYSVELVGAVLRQGIFIKRMHDLEWTVPNHFNNEVEDLALRHAIARYQAFWDLMSSSPTSFFVPTLDIDLVWHTHQIIPERYEKQCQMYLKRFIDHEDKVEGIRLSSAFDTTCRAWKARFNIDYAHCGCPLPGKTIGERLASLVKLHNKPPAHLVPYDHPVALALTHPSDHNAVRFVAKTESMHRRTTEKYQSLLSKRLEEKSNRSSEDSKKYIYNRTFCSETPFLLPVPMHFEGHRAATDFPTRRKIGGCIAANSSYVEPVGGCASCGSAGGCGGGGCATDSSVGDCSGDAGGCGGGGDGGAGCGGGCGGG
ncbi:hypothetical protein CVT26_011436 [Gymnopilus dilepis]|uniref:Uncharacterized protein n=1 Tax=Gymnopilus dilepis TaxID=231916 RepID=A0A409X0N4_9AGAR|nr:hypothetical protein CVT26_011436 [Gymnopilus dilepis]